MMHSRRRRERTPDTPDGSGPEFKFPPLRYTERSYDSPRGYTRGADTTTGGLAPLGGANVVLPGPGPGGIEEWLETLRANHSGVKHIKIAGGSLCPSDIEGREVPDQLETITLNCDAAKSWCACGGKCVRSVRCRARGGAHRSVRVVCEHGCHC